MTTALCTSEAHLDNHPYQNSRTSHGAVVTLEQSAQTMRTPITKMDDLKAVVDFARHSDLEDGWQTHNRFGHRPSMAAVVVNIVDVDRLPTPSLIPSVTVVLPWPPHVI
jgi:hypothetical protein